MHHTVTYTGCFDIRETSSSISFNGIKDGAGTSKRYVIPTGNVEEIEIGPKAKPPLTGQTITITYASDPDAETAEG